VIVPAAHAAPVPDGLDLLDAATLPVNTLTVAQLLPRLGQPQGRRLLVTGAAGGLGGFAVALAARAGWTVIALARESAQGTLESRRAGTLPLTDAAVAYRALRAGGQRGSWVLTP